MSDNLLSDSVDPGERESDQRRRATAAATGRPEDEPEVRLNVEVPESLRADLKDRCAEEGRTIKWVLNRLVRHYAEGGELP